jgi:hypothetical protein
MPSLVVETGLIISGANSFISLADFQTYCEDRGRVLDSYDDDTEIIPSIIKMADYLNSMPWKGWKTERSNPMSWPRYGDTLSGWNEIHQPASMWLGVIDGDGFIIPVSEVPAEVTAAQCEGAWLILTGSVLEPALERGGELKREKYDVIEFEYFSGAPTTTEFKTVTNRLNGLLQSVDTRELVRS